MMDHAAQLAGIAIARRLAEEALAGERSAVSRPLREHRRRRLSEHPRRPAALRQPGLREHAGLRQRRGTVCAAERCNALLEPERSRRVHPPGGLGRGDPQRGIPDAPARWGAGRHSRERARGPRCKRADHALRGHDCRHHRAQARGAGGVRREGAGASDAAIDRRRRHQHRCRRPHRIHQSGRRESDRLDARGGARSSDRRRAATRQRDHSRADREPAAVCVGRRGHERAGRPFRAASPAPATRWPFRSRRRRSATARDG